MPANGDGAHAEQFRDRRNGGAFDFVEDQDRAPARRQRIERPPDRRARDQFGFDAAAIDRRRRVRGRPPAHRLLAPSIAADIDQDPDQPRFLVRHARGDGLWRARRAQKGLLDDVAGVVRRSGQAAGEAVEADMVSVEQLGETLRGVGSRGIRGQ